MRKLLTRSVALCALLVLLMGAVSSADESSPGAAGRTAEERLVVSYEALLGLYDRFKRPTVRQFLRRLVVLNRQGEKPAFPGFTWTRTKRQENLALEGFVFNGRCSECALLIAPGRNGSDKGRDAKIRPGAFFAGFTEEGKLFCVGPDNATPRSCQAN